MSNEKATLFEQKLATTSRTRASEQSAHQAGNFMTLESIMNTSAAAMLPFLELLCLSCCLPNRRINHTDETGVGDTGPCFGKVHILDTTRYDDFVCALQTHFVFCHRRQNPVQEYCNLVVVEFNFLLPFLVTIFGEDAMHFTFLPSRCPRDDVLFFPLKKLRLFVYCFPFHLLVLRVLESVNILRLWCTSLHGVPLAFVKLELS